MNLQLNNLNEDDYKQLSNYLSAVMPHVEFEKPDKKAGRTKFAVGDLVIASGLAIGVRVERVFKVVKVHNPNSFDIQDTVMSNPKFTGGAKAYGHIQNAGYMKLEDCEEVALTILKK